MKYRMVLEIVTDGSEGGDRLTEAEGYGWLSYTPAPILDEHRVDEDGDPVIKTWINSYSIKEFSAC